MRHDHVKFATVGGYTSRCPEAYVAAKHACGSTWSTCDLLVDAMVCANFVSCYPEGCAAASRAMPVQRARVLEQARRIASHILLVKGI